MFHPWVRRGWRQTGGPPKKRRVWFALMLVVSFVTAAMGTALASGEGGTHTSTENSDWGHLIGHGTTDDCLWMHHHIKTARAWWGVTAAPELYTYGSVDGSTATPTGGVSQSCSITNKTLPRQQLGVQQSLGHWLAWMNDNRGGWAWCNNGPWVYNTSAAFDHDAATGFTWVPWPCQDQSANGADNWFFGFHNIWAGPARVGGEVTIGAISDWIRVYMS